MKGPFSPPWCTLRRRPSAPRLSLEPSLRITAHFSSAQLKTPADSLICYYSNDSTSFLLGLLSESGPHLPKAAFPEQLVQDKVLDGIFWGLVLFGNGVHRLLFCLCNGDVCRSIPGHTLQLWRQRLVRQQKDPPQLMEAVGVRFLPLVVGTVVEVPVISPDGARTIPGWPTLTGPSRPMASLSLVVLA